jgi:uncharacterized protein YllA (UPF0747 family)
MAVNESNFDKIDNFEDRLVRFDNNEFSLLENYTNYTKSNVIKLTQNLPDVPYKIMEKYKER